MAPADLQLTIRLPSPHAKQRGFIDETAKRKVVRAGRRGGKTVGVSVLAVEAFLQGRRVLYAAPTQEQVDRFWHTVCAALKEAIEHGVYYKNETLHVIELLGTEQRIRAKTAWNSDTLRGDYADLLILDEFQLMDEKVWEEVGVPMLLDNNGDAVFIYTPPSLTGRANSKARDPQFCSKLFKKAQKEEAKAVLEGKEKRWAAFHFTSHDNPYISDVALAEIVGDMTAVAYRQEIMAEDVDEAPGSLWKRETIEKGRVTEIPELELIVVAVDPSATSGGDEAGIIVAGKKGDHFYVLEDDTVRGSPYEWGKAAVTAYNKYKANRIIAEANNGGEMVALTIGTVDKDITVELVHASRGKETRAEPIAAIYEQGRGHHMGSFPWLEDEMCLWQPGLGMPSPGRMDAMVWAAAKLVVGQVAASAQEWLEALKRANKEVLDAELP